MKLTLLELCGCTAVRCLELLEGMPGYLERRFPGAEWAGELMN